MRLHHTPYSFVVVVLAPVRTLLYSTSLASNCWEFDTLKEYSGAICSVVIRLRWALWAPEYSGLGVLVCTGSPAVFSPGMIYAW